MSYIPVFVAVGAAAANSSGVVMGDVARAMLVLSAVIASGMAVGSLKVKGLGLGAAAVLFAGLAFGHLGGAGGFSFQINAAILEFARDFGLALFVYAVGMQVGPSFFGSLRKQGLGLNVLALCVVLSGTILAAGVILFKLANPGQSVGIYTGAVTNTPAMAAAGLALEQMAQVAGDAGGGALQTMRNQVPIGYAVAYPGAVAGIIGALLLVKWIFKVDLTAEAREHARALEVDAVAVSRITVRVDNPGVAGRALADMTELFPEDVVVSRLRRGEITSVAPMDYVLASGDKLLLVGDARKLGIVAACLGSVVDEDLQKHTGPLCSQRLLVTDRKAIGTRLGALRLQERHGVTATRVYRGDREFPASRNLVLQAGDLVNVVGEQVHIGRAAAAVGNSLKALNHPHFIPLFLGLGLGVLLGGLSIPIPGVPIPVKLGLAGGPLLVALVTSSLLRVGPLVFYLPPNALLFMRELGISLFLACVGLKSGPDFWPSIEAGGAIWILYGLVLTIIPLVVCGVVARVFFKMNFLTLSGVLSGAMTDPPALSFAQNITQSEGAAVSYSLVYPLTMFLRILTAQLLVIFLT
ncbi:MAG: putative transporter [Puniceicoccales bacterium]|jgi:putative transport protein|nr:putative transporter [Puniceicoccales bacterium]